MTVIISIPQPNWIVMCADSRLTTTVKTQRDSSEVVLEEVSTEYSSTEKIFAFPKLGCVSVWGDLTHFPNNFTQLRYVIPDNVRDIFELRSTIEDFLKNTLCPHERDADSEIGFHVGGFTPNHEPKLWHIFYGRNRPPIEGELPDYRIDEFPIGTVLYNGRNDYAHGIIGFLNRVQIEVRTPIFMPDPIRQMVLADFITRYISEQTPDVGGSIKTVLISKENFLFQMINKDSQPIGGEMENLATQLNFFMRAKGTTPI